MSSTLFKVCVLALVLSAVLASPALTRKDVKRRGITGVLRRVGGGIKGAAGVVGSGITGAAGVVGSGVKGAVGLVGSGAAVVGGGIVDVAGAVGSGVKDAAVFVGGLATQPIKWMFPASYTEADTVEEEAEIVLSEAEKTIQQGSNLVSKGEWLLKQAEELEQSLGDDVGKRDDGDERRRGIGAAIRALRAAAQKSISAGQKIMANSGKIADALKEAVANISTVVAEGVADVGAAIVDLTDSVAQAAVVLNELKTKTDMASLALSAGNPIEQVREREAYINVNVS